MKPAGKQASKQVRQASQAGKPGKPASKQASQPAKPSNQQVRKHASKQANQPASKQASWPPYISIYIYISRGLSQSEINLRATPSEKLQTNFEKTINPEPTLYERKF